jgi:hypothetical protein
METGERLLGAKLLGEICDGQVIQYPAFHTGRQALYRSPASNYAA